MYYRYSKKSNVYFLERVQQKKKELGLKAFVMTKEEEILLERFKEYSSDTYFLASKEKRKMIKALAFNRLLTEFV